MTIPVLESATPVTVPAKVFDKLWVEEVVISAPDPNGDASARVRVRRFCTTDGLAELEPEQGQWIEIKDVLSGSATDPDLAAVVGSLMTYIAKIGTEQGVVAAD